MDFKKAYRSLNKKIKRAASKKTTTIINTSGGSSGATTFLALTDTPSSFSGQAGKFVKVNAGSNALEFATLAGGGDLLSSNNLSDLTNASTARTNLGLNTTANQTDSTDKRFMTDAQETKLDAITGTNTGDQTSIVGITGTKAQFNTAVTDGDFMYVGDAPTTHSHVISDITSLQTTLDGKASSTHSHAISDVTGLQTALDGKQASGSYAASTHTHAISDITNLQTTLDGKEPVITNGFGLTGTTTKAISLTTAQAFCTAETTLSAATYADITGASISLAAGTWLILATINGSSQTTTATVLIAAITDNANTVIAEGAQHIVAGTATVRTWGNVTLSAIVTPASTTTYKLRGARGATTQTGNCIVSDGTGLNTANNVSNNSDKSTSIRAIRIA